MSWVGADTEAMRSLAAELDRLGDEIEVQLTDAVIGAERLTWSGQDAAAFQQRVASVQSRLGSMLREHLAAASATLRANAMAQDETSATLDGYGSSSSLHGGSVSPDGAMPSFEPCRVDEISPRTIAARDEINRLQMTEELRRLLGLRSRSDSDLMRIRLYGDILRDSSAKVLFFDPSGDGRIGVVQGDLATASNIAVTVPGIGTNLDNYGRQMEEASRLLDSSGDAAVISWLGYDAPVGVGWNPLRFWSEVPSDSMAQVGASDLSTFVHELRNGRPDATITVIGHSYGSLVTGIAARQGLAADNVVFLGSPGVGADSVHDFDLPDDAHVYAASTDGHSLFDDYVTDIGEYVGPFGRVPTDPSFGATVIEVGPGTTPWGSHTQYYDEGSPSLLNLGSIVQGQGALLVKGASGGGRGW